MTYGEALTKLRDTTWYLPPDLQGEALDALSTLEDAVFRLEGLEY